MSLVAAKCTQCGANINIDNTKEAGICEYCGTAFITEKAINYYNAYIINNNSFEGANINVVGGDIENFLKLAKNAIEAKTGQEALDDANRALEIQADSSEAWIRKMEAMQLLSGIDDLKFNEIVSCASNAIKYASGERKRHIKIKIYRFLMQRSLIIMEVALELMENTENTQKAFKAAGISITGISMVQQADCKNIDKLVFMAGTAINFKLKIPETYISNNKKMQEQILILAKLFIRFCNAEVARMKIYGLSPSEQANKERRMWLQKIKEGLSEEKSAEIKSEEIVR